MNPQKSGESVEGDERDERGRFKKGHKKLGGGIKGSISFNQYIKQYLEQHPEEFKEICDYYMFNKRMRGMLWEQIDGKAKQSMDVSGKMEIKTALVEFIGDNGKSKDSASK